MCVCVFVYIFNLSQFFTWLLFYRLIILLSSFFLVNIWHAFDDGVSFFFFPSLSLCLSLRISFSPFRMETVALSIVFLFGIISFRCFILLLHLVRKRNIHFELLIKNYAFFALSDTYTMNIKHWTDLTNWNLILFSKFFCWMNWHFKVTFPISIVRKPFSLNNIFISIVCRSSIDIVYLVYL